MVWNLREWRISLSTIMKRFLDSKYSLWLIEICILVVAALALISIWTIDVSIDIQYVPEIMSGLTSCTAILIGFTAACLTIMRKYYAKNVGQLFVLLFYLLVPVMCLFIAYLELVLSTDFIVAIRAALSGFAFSLIVVYVALFLAIKEYW